MTMSFSIGLRNSARCCLKRKLRFFSPNKQGVRFHSMFPGDSGTQPKRDPAKGLPRKIPIPGVKHIILVSSAKGGVGKSTSAVNIALSLKEQGAKVGLLDADVYGPSIPLLTNLVGKTPSSTKNKLIIPLLNYGLKIMSMGFLIDDDKAIVWRGLMVMSAIRNLTRRVLWGELDYLVVDMPPGTGDTQLTIAQELPVSGAVIISTPQDVALIDARRGVKMFNEVNIPVLGIIQNMSVFSCPHCNKDTHIFGQEGVDKMAKEMGIEVLGNVPLDVDVRLGCDKGLPITVSAPEGKIATVYKNISEQIAKKLV